MYNGELDNADSQDKAERLSALLRILLSVILKCFIVPWIIEDIKNTFSDKSKWTIV